MRFTLLLYDYDEDDGDDERRKRRSCEEALNNYSADFHLTNALIGHRARLRAEEKAPLQNPIFFFFFPYAPLCRYSSSSSSSVFFLVVDVECRRGLS